MKKKFKKFAKRRANKYCNAKLITGNLKHFPKDKDIMSANEFLEKYGKNI